MPNMMGQQMGFGAPENQNLFMQMMLANAMSQQDMGANPQMMAPMMAQMMPPMQPGMPSNMMGLMNNDPQADSNADK